MSYRKVLSQGSVPFTWEDKPGVSKFKCPIDKGVSSHSSALETMPKPMPMPLSLPLPPPPPCRWERYFSKAPAAAALRSMSKKRFWWQPEDPFLAAYKECTKTVKNGASASKKGFDFGVLKSFSIFSCKTSIASDVRDDNYVRLARLPPLPRERNRIIR